MIHSQMNEQVEVVRRVERTTQSILAKAFRGELTSEVAL